VEIRDHVYQHDPRRVGACLRVTLRRHAPASAS
jgi:hypothetical protein